MLCLHISVGRRLVSRRFFNQISFFFGRGDPSPTVALSFFIVGEAFGLPLASNLIKTTAERTKQKINLNRSLKVFAELFAKSDLNPKHKLTKKVLKNNTNLQKIWWSFQQFVENCVDNYHLCIRYKRKSDGFRHLIQNIHKKCMIKMLNPLCWIFFYKVLKNTKNTNQT